MKEERILYQLKSLEKNIIRYFSKDSDEKYYHNHKEKIKSITPTQIQIIEYIYKNESKDIYQKDLENILNLRRATVSGVLQTMEKNGLLERTINQTDTRTKKIILNPKAKKMYIETKKKLEELDNIINNDISKEELEIFKKVINQINKNINDLRERKSEENDKNIENI